MDRTVFQSLIWVACPTGGGGPVLRSAAGPVSIPHMGCMPYGPRAATLALLNYNVSIPHMGCMPYGQELAQYGIQNLQLFQSLIWVACPTGKRSTCVATDTRSFQSLIWVACPTGQEWHRPPGWCGRVSIPHMGCMPYGRLLRNRARAALSFQSLIWVACPTGVNICLTTLFVCFSFNPSYGLHALRAGLDSEFGCTILVSIPHMGCMPYGPLRRTHKLTLI